MAGPITAPTLESVSQHEQIASLREEVERLHTIIALYIAPNYDIFSDDECANDALKEAIKRKRERNAETIETVLDIEADVQDIKIKLAKVSHHRKPGEKTQERLKTTDEFLLEVRNQPVTFARMAQVQCFKEKYRDQDMTKLGHIYEQFPDKYEVRASKLGGKTIRLCSSYFNRLTKGGH